MSDYRVQQHQNAGRGPSFRREARAIFKTHSSMTNSTNCNTLSSMSCHHTQSPPRPSKVLRGPSRAASLQLRLIEHVEQNASSIPELFPASQGEHQAAQGSWLQTSWGTSSYCHQAWEWLNEREGGGKETKSMWSVSWNSEDSSNLPGPDCKYTRKPAFKLQRSLLLKPSAIRPQTKRNPPIREVYIGPWIQVLTRKAEGSNLVIDETL